MGSNSPLLPPAVPQSRAEKGKLFVKCVCRPMASIITLPVGSLYYPLFVLAFPEAIPLTIAVSWAACATCGSPQDK